jgi:hypothetical protein
MADPVYMAEVAIRISESIGKFLLAYSKRQNLNRKKIIRTILRHLKSEYPEYNIVVLEQGIGFYDNLVDNVFKKNFDIQDLITKFKIEILLFKKGTISILNDVDNGKKWGCLGNIDWNKVAAIDATGNNIFAFDEPDITKVYEIIPRKK